jgi:hypothetical protein
MSQNNESTPGQSRTDHAGIVEDANALNAAFPRTGLERRQAPRLKYHVVATLEPVASGPDDVKVVTREASATGTSFVSGSELVEGTRAVLHMPSPEADGEMQRIECRVRRSRELSNGLFEGSVEFMGEQPQFSDTRIRPGAAKGANE